LLVIQLRDSGAREPSLNAVHNRDHQLQIAQQFGGGSGGRFLLCQSLRFEKQVGSFQNALAHRR